MSSEWELDEGIKSIKSAWRREHTARANLEKMLQQAETENAKLRDVIESEIHCWKGSCNGCVAHRPAEDGWCDQQSWLEELGIKGHL